MEFRGKVKAVELQLIELFSLAEMDIPDNIHKIAEDCYQYIKGIDGDFHNGHDIAEAFKKWIESK